MSYWSWLHQQLFLFALKRPKKRQERVLKKIINNIASTKYGLLFNVHSSDRYDEFSAKVPIVSYDKLKHWIDRQKNHESNILIDERVTRYVVLPDSKILPYTQSLEKSFRKLLAIQPDAQNNYLEAPLFVQIPQNPNLLPMLTEVFFEFSNANKKIFRLHELKKNQEYEVIISQKAGLYRYKTGIHVLTCSATKKTKTFSFQVLHDLYSDLRQTLD